MFSSSSKIVRHFSAHWQRGTGRKFWRNRPPSEATKPPPKSAPVDWLQDATTYSDAQTIMADPWPSGPYPQEDLHHLLKQAAIAKRESTEPRRKPNEPRFDANRLQFNFEHIQLAEQKVLLFPGQGSQRVGMGQRAVDSPAAARLFANASEILGYDLLELCLHGPKARLDATIHCQPAVFVASLAALEQLKTEHSASCGENFMTKVTDVAGFSVGEYAALVAAGALSFENALQIVKVRAEAMQACCERVPSGMMTIRVFAKSKLEEACKDAISFAFEKGQAGVCTTANYLHCGVRVIGASEKCLDFLQENAEKYFIQVVKRLAVSGAFHTELMSDAFAPVTAIVRDTPIVTPDRYVYSNCTGMVYDRRPHKIRELMVKQLVQPVKWEQIQQLLFQKRQEEVYPQYMEIGPGRQLAAMFAQVSKNVMKSNFTNYSV